MPRRVLVLGGALWLAGCQLTEVAIPAASPRVVVHAVLAREALEQRVFVEQSLTGGNAPLGLDAGLSDDAPRPISGASVVLTYPDGTPCRTAGAADTLTEGANAGSYFVLLACAYGVGNRVRLRVSTPDGSVVTGETTLPGAERVVVTVGGRSTEGAGIAGRPLVPLNRDQDTLEIAVVPIMARAMQVQLERPGGLFGNAPDVVFDLPSDSLGLRLPGSLVNPFEGDEGRPFLFPGVEYTLGVAVTDTNLFDFARSFSDPFTGRGFLNHLQGGIGVFGSAETSTFRLRVTGDVDDPREGRYHVTGLLEQQPVDLFLDVYLDPRGNDAFNALVDGRWITGAISVSAAGSAPLEGFEAGVFQFSFALPGDSPLSSEAWSFRGVRPAAGATFALDVSGFGPAQRLSAVQVSGPAP